MILGIIGFVAAIPGLLVSTAFSVIIEDFAPAFGEATGTGITIFAVFAIPILAGFIFGFLAKSKAVLSGIVMTASSIILLILVIPSDIWAFGVITVACYLIGGILAFLNK